MSDRSDGSFKFLSGLLLGAAGGFVAGILLAAKPGRELRRDIGANSEELLSMLKSKLGRVKDKTDEAFKQSAINIQDKVVELGRQLDQLVSDN